MEVMKNKTNKIKEILEPYLINDKGEKINNEHFFDINSIAIWLIGKNEKINNDNKEE